MKILIGMTRSDTIVSGSFKHICQIGARFREKGAEVVYVLGGDGDAIGKLLDQGFKVHTIPNLKRELNPISDFFSLCRLIWLILLECPTVCSWHTAKIGALGRIASMFTFKRSYYIPHGVPFVNTPENKGFKKYQVIEKVLSYLPSKIIGVCEFDKNEYIRIGVSKSKLLVIRNGMLGVKSDLKPSGKLTHFITAARFEDQKDYKTLAEACKQLLRLNKPFMLSIYGDGKQESIVKSMFTDFPKGTVNFCGVVDDFSNRLAEADVFVLSSHWEGLPRSIIEAMGCRKAVVASDVGGAHELIDHEKTGFLIPHKDPLKMRKAMECYIDCSEKHIQHGEAGYIKFQNNYTLEMMLENYVEEYFHSRSEEALL